MTSIGTLLFTWLRGKLVGTDGFGNRYYRVRGEDAGKDLGPLMDRRMVRRMDRRDRRWVIFAGEVEASSVPPVWHAWLHHTTDDVPSHETTGQRPWQKAHHPNFTGTDKAYRPEGSALRGGHRAKATGDYEPWRPS